MYRTLNLGLRAAVVAALACGPAQAQTAAKPAVSFPTSFEHPALVAWMNRETDIPPETVVAISPLAIVAIARSQPTTTPDGYEVTLRAETLDEAFSQREGLASWRATMKLDCNARTFSMGEVTGYPGRNLKGDGRPIQTAIIGARPITPGTMQGEIWSARCDKSFRFPLADAAARGPAPPVKPSPAFVAAQPAKPAATLPAKQVEPKPVEAKAVEAKAGPKVPAPAKPSGRPSSVQILSSPTPAESARALSALKARLGDAMAGLSTSVVPVVTDGKTKHRAIVSGFPSSADARAFCQKLQASGGQCFAREDAGRSASEKAP